MRAVAPVRAVSVPLAVGRASSARGRRHRVPGRDPDARRQPPGHRARDCPPVVLRDGRRLAGPRAPVAGRGVRHLRRGGGRRDRRRPPGRPAGCRARSSDSTADYGADEKDYYRTHVRQGRRRARSPPATRPGRRRSTPRSAATSTPTPGASRSRPTSPSALRDLPAALRSSERQARCADLSGRALSQPRRRASAIRPTPSSQVVVAQRVGQPQVARGAERLARDDRHLGLVQDQRGQLPRTWSAPVRAASGRADP